MSTDHGFKVIETAKSPALINPDINLILDRRGVFFATAMYAEMLQPYFQSAKDNLSLADAGEKKHTSQVNSGRLSEAQAKEIRQHLSELQSSAFTQEAHGAVERAKEIRLVASCLAEMLKITEELGTQQSLTNTRTAGKS